MPSAIDLLTRATWIAMPAAARGRAAPLMRCTFHLPAAVARAALHICGLGCYEAWCNGRRVGDHVLDPAQTDYDQRVFYVSHDVSDLLAVGGNALGVMLGDGWFNQDRVWLNLQPSYGQPRVLAALHVELTDGTSRVIVSDESWHCAAGPVTDNNLYAGECYDARRERPGWATTGCEDADWLAVERIEAPCGRLEPQRMPPMRRVEQRRPVAISERRPGVRIVDMGQNFAGWARLRVRATVGTQIVLRFAETLTESGELDTASTGVFATHVEQIDRYACRGDGVETWEPRFTYHGFRYVEVTGYPGVLSAGDITGIVVHTDLPVAGSFNCSDDRLNQLHRMAVWTHRSNIHGLPEDCPARERCGWLGDANVVAEMSMWNYRGEAFWRKYLNDIETTRRRGEGLPGAIAPGKRTFWPANPDWAAAFILLPWYVYQFYGDASVLSEHYEGGRRLIEHFAEQADNWVLTKGYGDWFDPGSEQIVSSTPPALTSTLWFMRCAQVMSRSARLLGKDDDAARYADWAGRIREAFIAGFYDRAKGTFGSQTADAMALHLGAVPDGEAQRVVAALVDDIHRRDDHLNVGIMGVRFLFETLTRRGHGELAMKIMRQDTYPGFGDLIRRGATTLWEWWGEDQLKQTHGPRSMNHPMFAGYDNWFYNTLAGIEPDENAPGFAHFTLRPHPIAGLHWLKAHHQSPRGRIVVEWRVTGEQFNWRIEVPPGSSATLCLPGSVPPRHLSSGTYQGQSLR